MVFQIRKKNGGKVWAYAALRSVSGDIKFFNPEEVRVQAIPFVRVHKHPERVQRFDVSVGAAMVFYPEATDERCTVALMVDVDPIGLVRRGRSGGEPFALAHYVNDRPYAASSMLAVAIGQVFRTALRGECASRPELAASALPLKVHVPSVPCRGDADLVARLFEPLGWAVDAVSLPLDPALPHFGDSRYVDLTLTGNVRLADALAHLYVLLPVLDGSKHYWVGDDEVDKVVRRCRGPRWRAGERDSCSDEPRTGCRGRSIRESARLAPPRRISPRNTIARVE